MQLHLGTSLYSSECTVNTRLTIRVAWFLQVFVPLAFAEAELETHSEPLSFYRNVSASQELRDASTKANDLVSDYGVESSMRLDVFRAKLAAEKNVKASGVKLSDEEQRLVDKMILDGTRAGLALPDAEREELMRLKKELSQACNEFRVSRRRLSVICGPD